MEKRTSFLKLRPAVPTRSARAADHIVKARVIEEAMLMGGRQGYSFEQRCDCPPVRGKLCQAPGCRCPPPAGSTKRAIEDVERRPMATREQKSTPGVPVALGALSPFPELQGPERADRHVKTSRVGYCTTKATTSRM